VDISIGLPLILTGLLTEAVLFAFVSVLMIFGSRYFNWLAVRFGWSEKICIALGAVIALGSFAGMMLNSNFFAVLALAVLFTMGGGIIAKWSKKRSPKNT
jgi:uncharacterized membrane protein YeiH